MITLFLCFLCLSWLFFDNETDIRCRRTADVEGGDTVGVFYLVIAGSSGCLLEGIEQLTSAGSADGMAAADETAGGIYGEFTAAFNDALLNSLK